MIPLFLRAHIKPLPDYMPQTKTLEIELREGAEFTSGGVPLHCGQREI